MPAFDALAPDQKAVLQLLLKQGKTYEQIAGLLRLEATNVRERALDALDALGAGLPGAEELASDRQDELADHLLLQQTADERAGTRTFLEGSAPGRAWARGVSEELRPIGGDALPEIPAEPAPSTAPPEPDAPAEPAPTEPATVAAVAVPDEPAPAAEPEAGERRQSSSRLGGVLVLAAVAAVLVLGIFLLVRGLNADDTVSPSSAPATAAAQAPSGTSGTTGTAAGTALPQQQINLTPPSKGSKALGYALLAPDGFSLLAEGLPESNMYLIWLYNAESDALPVGFAQYDAATKRLAGGIASLPGGAEKYSSVIVTRETSRRPTKPGKIVLRGPVKQS